MEVLKTARNALGACRPPSGTTARRQPATPQRQPQHPRSTAPRQSPSRTVYNSPAEPLEAGRAIAKPLARTDPNAACMSSSQPPLLECCDDRLNPPSIPETPVMGNREAAVYWVTRSSRVMTAENAADAVRLLA